MTSSVLFSAVHQIADRLRRRSIPFIAQVSEGECGAACLSMVMQYHGRMVDRFELRDRLAVGRDGSNAYSLIAAARSYGFQARGVRIDIDDFEYLPPATILHWNFNHFVVLESTDRGGIGILDPGVGRRRIAMKEASQSFTGIAVLVEPTATMGPSEISRPAASRSLYRTEFAAERVRLRRIVVTSLFLQFLGLSLPMATGVLIDHVIPHSDRNLLVVTASWVAAIVIFFFLATLLRSRLLLHLRTAIDARLTTAFVNHLLRLPYTFFENRSVGDLTMRLNSNAMIREILTSSMLSSFLDGSFASMSVLLLLVLSTKIGLIVLLLAIVQIAIVLLTRERQRELLARDLNAQVRAQGYQFEMLSGVRSLKAMGVEERAEDRWTNLFFEVLNAALDRGHLAALVEALLAALRVAAPLVILAVGAQGVLDHGERLGPMLGMTALATSALVPIAGLVNTATQIHTLQAYRARLDDVFDSSWEQVQRRPPMPRLQGTMSIESVSFRYSANGPLVVKDVSVSISSGMLVAIVGASGSGKSTLASLLLGLYRPSAGSILMDGIDIQTVDLHSLRRQIGYVGQSLDLFSGSIRSNITLGDPTIPMSKVMEVAAAVALSNEVAAMPMGYETPVGENAGSLSGGQAQRVALARALLREPALLVLDEATSALDSRSEAHVQTALKALRCTRIVIAHRLSTVVNADMILVMANGEIVERGNHEELLKRGGAYANLVEAQLGSSTAKGIS